MFTGSGIVGIHSEQREPVRSQFRVIQFLYFRIDSTLGGLHLPTSLIATIRKEIRRLFLDDAKVKNFITCFKDKQFLVFFFKQIRRNETGRYEDDFPYISPCGRERNFIRCDDRPIVFTHLLSEQSTGRHVLSYCGGGDKLTVMFEPEKLVMFPENGRVYHPAPAKCDAVGLVKSSLAFELSPCFEYSSESKTGHPTHFNWDGNRYTLTNELIQLII
ncbi:Hypothetical predicted protein [Pelobates cultripes]|uniref:Uncharacterized protein n=1 Tax=Pelobates cultripes TaxID=61616 RepID=A0AAD1W2R3_PELCU|nr:Hypothetical predicted protein [Pelobates cultripes]